MPASQALLLVSPIVDFLMQPSPPFANAGGRTRSTQTSTADSVCKSKENKLGIILFSIGTALHIEGGRNSGRSRCGTCGESSLGPKETFTELGVAGQVLCSRNVL